MIIDIFNESRIIAGGQKEILEKIYDLVKHNNLSLPIDLSKINTSVLKDFVLYTSGFLGVNDEGGINDNLSEEQIRDIIKGKFKIRTVSREDALNIMQMCGVDLEKKKDKKEVLLLKVQDAEYWLKQEKTPKGEREKIYSIVLTTKPVKVELTADSQKMTDKLLLKEIRNITAHSTPLIDGSSLIFKRHGKTITTSKMWLRGYTETIASIEDVNSRVIKNKIRAAIQCGHSLDNTDRLKALLHSILDESSSKTPPEISENISFISKRVNLCNHFYRLDEQTKIDVLTDIILTNYHYLETGKGKLSPKVLYTIQQNVGQNIESRKEMHVLSVSDFDLDEIERLRDREEDLKKKFRVWDVNADRFTNKQGALKTGNVLKTSMEQLEKDKRKMLYEFNVLQKIESSQIGLVGGVIPEHFIPEYAVSLVCLMGYNALVTSSFYEEVLKEADYQNPTPEYESLINSFTIPTKTFKTFDVTHKTYALKNIRNSLCHGNVTYTLPKTNYVGKINLDEIEISFESDIYDAVITGSLKEFYQLFSNPSFYQERHPLVKTQTNTVDNIQCDQKKLFDARIFIAELQLEYEQITQEEYNQIVDEHINSLIRLTTETVVKKYAPLIELFGLDAEEIINDLIDRTYIDHKTNKIEVGDIQPHNGSDDPENDDDENEDN